MQEVVLAAPEEIEIANAYLQYGDISRVADYMSLPAHKITEMLGKKPVKAYMDAVYLDMGYRNRDRIASAMDKLIEQKLEQAEETGLYSSKDLADLLQMAHRMRMDEIKAIAETEKQAAQTNIQVNNDFGSNYGKLMEDLLKNG